MKNKIFLLSALLAAINPPLSTAFPNKVVKGKSVIREIVRTTQEKINNPSYNDLVLLNKAVNFGDGFTILGALLGLCGFASAFLAWNVKEFAATAILSSSIFFTLTKANEKINQVKIRYNLPPILPIVEKA